MGRILVLASPTALALLLDMRVAFGGGGFNSDLGDALVSWFEGRVVVVANKFVVVPEVPNGSE